MFQQFPVITWINFIYHKFKEIPLYPYRARVQQYMLECLRTKYPTAQLIIDYTEVKVDNYPIQPSYKLNFPLHEH